MADQIQPVKNTEQIAVDATEQAIKGAASGAAAKAPMDNGKTAIGTNAADTGGNKPDLGAAQAITSHGLHRFELRKLDGGEQMKKDLRTLLHDKPSDAQKDATIKDLGKKVDDSKSIPDGLKQSVKDIEAGLIKGNVNAVGGTIHALESNADPTALKTVLDAVNKGLHGSGVKLDIEKGKNGDRVVAYGRGGDQAVVFSPDGSASVHEAKRIEEGGFTLGGKVLGGETAARALDGLGDRITRRLSDTGWTQEFMPNRPSEHAFPGAPGRGPDSQGPGGDAGRPHDHNKRGQGLAPDTPGLPGQNYRHREHIEPGLTPKLPGDAGNNK